jgi:hypothetical protein
MKYFTAEIWGGWQKSDEDFERANKTWDRNLALYKASLKKTVHRLDVKQGRFFTNESLHDGHLLQFSVSDWPSSNLTRKQATHKTTVYIAVLAGNKRALI